MHERQYPIVAARRQAYDTLLWQTPALGIAGESFLITASLNKDTPATLATMLALAACFVALASLQFFRRLRFMEMYDAELLREFESTNEQDGFAVVHGPKPLNGIILARGLAKYRSFEIWNVLLTGFFGLALCAFIASVAKLTSEISN